MSAPETPAGPLAPPLLDVHQAEFRPAVLDPAADAVRGRLAGEDALQESEAQFRAVFDLVPVGIALVEVSTLRIQRVNQRLATFLGYTAEELCGLRAGDFTHPDDLAQDRRVFAEAARGAPPTEPYEKRYLRRDGSVCWASVSLTVLPGPSGAPSLAVAAVVDITARKAAEATQRLQSTALQAAANGIAIFAVDGCFQWMNEAYCRLTGYAAEELVGQPASILRDDPASDERTARVRQAVLGGSAWSGQLKRRRKDGSTFDCNLTLTPVRDELGTITHVVTVEEDITETRRAQERLRASEERYRTLVDNLDDVIFSTDREGRITFVNRAVQRFGYSPDAVVGQHRDSFIHPDDLARTHRAWPHLAPDSNKPFESNPLESNPLESNPLESKPFESNPLESNPLESNPLESNPLESNPLESKPFEKRPLEYRLLDAAGKVHCVRGSSRPLVVDGRLAGATGVIVDLTAQRDTEEQLRAAQKMEAVGRLAGGVAHDFNNLLSVILSYTELAVMDLRQGDPLRADLEEVVQAAKRAEGLTRQLLAFSRRQVLQPEPLELAEVVAGLAKMLGRLIGEDIELVLAMPEGLHPTQADRGQLEQVLMNLVVNARDAMPDGGTLTLSGANVELDATQAAYLSTEPGPFVRLTVADTGCGMDDATKARIFEPFFTTKGLGKGTGLGLSMVHGIVYQSGGGLSVESLPGQGAAFHIYLPRHHAELLPAERPVSTSGPARGNECILVVEDDTSLRNLVRRVLASAGYNVLLAASPGEALLLAEKRGAEIDLVLTDVVMPGMNGRQLANRLRPLCPRARTLYMSGYIGETLERHDVLGSQFLPKPFDRQTLTRKIRSVLEGPRLDQEPGAK